MSTQYSQVVHQDFGLVQIMMYILFFCRAIRPYMVHVQIFVWSHYAIFVDGKESGTSSLVSSRLLEWPIGSVTMPLISSTWMDTSTEEIRIFHGILTPWPDRDKSNDKKKSYR